MNLIITGNPGVGKHTIANLLQEKNKSFQVLDISKFAIEKNLGEQVEDGIEIDTVKLTNEIKKVVLEETLIVGHLAPYVFDESIFSFTNFENFVFLFIFLPQYPC